MKLEQGWANIFYGRQWRTQKIFMGGVSKCQNFSLH